MKKGEKKTTRSKKISMRNPEDRENQLINLAINLAERQLRDGSATSQVITHFLKLATVKEQLENERLRADLKLSEAKIEHMKSQETSADLYARAIAAFRTYSGQYSESEDEFEDEYDD